MKEKKYLHIGLNSYELIECDNLSDVKEDFSSWGICDLVNKEIKIYSKRTAEDLSITLMHEILHAVLHEHGIEEYFEKETTNEENFITTFSALFCVKFNEEIKGDKKSHSTYSDVERFFEFYSFEDFIKNGCKKNISKIFLNVFWETLFQNELH